MWFCVVNAVFTDVVGYEEDWEWFTLPWGWKPVLDFPIAPFVAVCFNNGEFPVLVELGLWPFVRLATESWKLVFLWYSRICTFSIGTGIIGQVKHYINIELFTWYKRCSNSFKPVFLCSTLHQVFHTGDQKCLNRFL